MTQFESKIYFLLNMVALTADCRDKRVAAISVADERIIGLSTNTRRECNELCNHTCAPVHAEQQLNVAPGCTVYLNLYPCEMCQRYLYAKGVKNIVVFGEQHKQKVFLPEDQEIKLIPCVKSTLLSFNGVHKQKMVAAGECGELITALMDSFRTDREDNYREVVGEVVDVMLQAFLISDSTFMEEWNKKINKLYKKFIGEQNG